MFGPDLTFLGVDRCDLGDTASLAGADVVIIGAPFDGGTTYRAGARFGPSALRQACYLPHDGSRPSLALRADGLKDLRVLDAGDVEMPAGDIERSIHALEEAVYAVASAAAIPVVLGGDHTIALPDATGVARHVGVGKVSMVHFDAHADTGESDFGLLYGHGTPMRRLIESGAVPGRNFVQVGLRGYWPEPPVLAWMEEHELRTHFMAEIHRDGFGTVLERAVDEALDHADHLYLSLDVDVCDPAFTPGTGTPEPGGLTTAEVLWAVRRLAAEVGIVAMDVVEVSPPYDVGPGITALFARRAIMEALTGIAMRRLGLTEPDHVDPRSAGTGAPRTFRDRTTGSA